MSGTIQFLKSSVELFASFERAELDELVSQCALKTFNAHEHIIEFHERGSFMGVLLSGAVEVAALDAQGDIHEIARLQPGDLFGEMELMTGNATIANVVAVQVSTALIIDEVAFLHSIMSKPEAVRYLTRLISRRTTEHTRITSSDRFAYKFDAGGSSSELHLGRKGKLLVVNCGSSSLKYSLFDSESSTQVARGSIARIGGRNGSHTLRSGDRTLVSHNAPITDHRQAFDLLSAALLDRNSGLVHTPGEVLAVGHRVVHGGESFNRPTLIDEQNLTGIKALNRLAPLHNPNNVLGIELAQEKFPRALHVAVFDTSFHHTMPAYAYLYGLPYELYEKYRIRRYGFHGSSHGYVALKAAQFLDRPYNSLEIVSCHLGNGSSLCAIDHGRSVDTSMGFTPTQGVPMGTRCGDIDPGIFAFLVENEGLDHVRIEEIMNRESGLLGISGVSNDMRDIMHAAGEGNHRALLAFKTFCYAIRKYIGAYLAAMQGLDVVIFTGGIGEGSDQVRSMACQGLEQMGIIVDEGRNKRADASQGIVDISAADSPVTILVVPTNEEKMIARETVRALKLARVDVIIAQKRDAPIPIEVSAHHVHLSREHVAALFGEGHELTSVTELSQPGQFACAETVTLIGPKGSVQRVRVLGPTRQRTQVEIAMTEQYQLGIYPPIRESGDLLDTPGIRLESEQGGIDIDHGVICALRHIHMSPEDAVSFGVGDRDMVSVKVTEGDRELTFGDVLVRVGTSYALAMHIDTDEANAAHISTGAKGYIQCIQ
ncbi:MAG: acetate/propionate family kinase [Chitinivibrionales bacterium]|nr:acetate/propionate family kinase [Chitinivibrionales bacterium]